MQRIGFRTILSTTALLGLMLIPSASQAMYRPGTGAGGGYPFPGPKPGGAGQAHRLFRASANHTCWSKEVIGYSCFVSGIGYNDCMQARFSLGQMSGCCRNHTYNGKTVTNGSSTGMTAFSCTNW